MVRRDQSTVGRTNERFRGTTQRFGGTNERFGVTIQRLERTNQRFAGTSQRFRGASRWFGGTNQWCGGANRRFGGLINRKKNTNHAEDMVDHQIAGTRMAQAQTQTDTYVRRRAEWGQRKEDSTHAEPTCRFNNV